jgi:uncharacterized protein (UPF0548 family)
MFLLSRPDESRILTILSNQRSCHFSYPDVGASRDVLPAGYALLHGRIDLGRGSATYAQAVGALRQWKMFDVPGIRLCWPDAPILSGEAVAGVIKHFGFWSLNCCKIVYAIDEDGPIQRFGFAYGTLPEHAEQGEERFTVEWDRCADVVCYDILSFSRPGNAAVRLTYPVARWLQRRFLQRSLVARADAVRSTAD